MKAQIFLHLLKKLLKDANSFMLQNYLKLNNCFIIFKIEKIQQKVKFFYYCVMFLICLKSHLKETNDMLMNCIYKLLLAAYNF